MAEHDQINNYYTNEGTESGTLLKQLAKLYVGKPDDRIAQEALVRRFEREWTTDVVHHSPTPMNPNIPLFSSDYRTLTDDEIKALNEGATIYILRRLEYRDSTGDWRTDDCEALQKEAVTIDMRVGHACFMFVRDRYSVKRR
jgi:hypothetical protein